MDSIFFDHYDALGIEKDATKTEIRIGYRNAALEYHPDKHPSNPTKFTAQFRAVQEAYEVLNDPYRKAIYDVENRHRRNRTRSGRVYATPKGHSRKAKNPPKSSENPFTNPNVFTGTNKPFQKTTGNPSPNTEKGSSQSSQDNSFPKAQDYESTFPRETPKNESKNTTGNRFPKRGPFPSSANSTDSGAYSFSFTPPEKDRPPKNPFEWTRGPYDNSTNTHFPGFKAGSVPANAPRSEWTPKHSTNAPSDWLSWPKMGPEELASTASTFHGGEPTHDHLRNLPRPNPSRPSPRNCTMMVCTISNTSLRFATGSRLLFDSAPDGMYQCTLYSHGKFQQSFNIPTDLKEPGWYAFALEGGNSNHNMLEMHIGGDVTTFMMVSQRPCKTAENICRCIFSVHGSWLPFELQQFN